MTDFEHDHARREAEALDAEFQRRRNENPLRYFVPNGKQEEANSLDSFIKLYSGGNGAGKSFWWTALLGNLIWGPQNDWYDIPWIRNFKRPFNARIISTHKAAEMVIDPTIREIWPASRYNGTKGGKQYMSQYKTDNGCLIDVMTHDQSILEFESATLQLIVLDEPCSWSIYQSCISRMRRGGYILFAMTPMAGAEWVYQKIFEDGDPDWKLVFAHAHDNCKRCGIRGTLDHDDLIRQAKQYDKETLAARVEGKFIFLGDRIYQSYNEKVHVIPNEEPPRGAPVGLTIDPHDGRPFAMAWFYVTPMNDIVFFKQWPDEPFHLIKHSDMSIEQYADLIHSQSRRYNMMWYLMDPNYGIQTRTSMHEKTSFKSEFRKLKLQFDCFIDNDLTLGHDRVRSYLHYDPKKQISLTNKPKLYVTEGCTNVRASLMKYSKRKTRSEYVIVSEEVSEKFKDFADIVRYTLMKEPRYRTEKPKIGGGKPQILQDYRA